MAWYFEVAKRAGTWTPYAIGRAVEPETYLVKNGERYHHNKWPKFEKGLHRPRRRTVAAAERKFPGAAQVFDWAIWPILKRVPQSHAEIALLEVKLAPEVRLLILRCRLTLQASKNGSIKRLQSVLERRGSLDALAVMALLCCAAKIDGNREQAREWVRGMQRLMLLLGPKLIGYGIAQPLFELMELRLFQPACENGWRYFFPPQLYLWATGSAHSVLWHIEGEPYGTMTALRRAHQHQRVLDGDFGWDLKFAFNPIKVLCDEDQVLSKPEAARCNQSLNVFRWALNMQLAMIPHPAFPPEGAFSGRDLHAVSPLNEEILERQDRRRESNRGAEAESQAA